MDEGNGIVWSETCCASEEGSSASKGEPTSAESFRQRVKMCMDKIRKSRSSGQCDSDSDYEDPENRNCVPKDVAVLDHLEESMLPGLHPSFGLSDSDSEHQSWSHSKCDFQPGSFQESDLALQPNLILKSHFAFQVAI